jgi:AICAR transformylase/IMP cyclohydrolase PurH
VAEQRALANVYDKAGLTEFVRRLAARGIEIGSTGWSGNCLVDTVN